MEKITLINEQKKIMQGPRRKLHRQSNEKLKLMFSSRAYTPKLYSHDDDKNFHLTHEVIYKAVLYAYFTRC